VCLPAGLSVGLPWGLPVGLPSRVSRFSRVLSVVNGIVDLLIRASSISRALSVAVVFVGYKCSEIRRDI
jgi:hypothetical protein